MQAQELLREFKYNSVALADPNPAFSLEQVRDFFSAVYPEILNAEIEGPAVKGNRQVYTFRRAVGTKGAAPVAQMLSDLTALLHAGWFDDNEAELVKAMHERAHAGVFAPAPDELAAIAHLHALHCSAAPRAELAA